jgi:hypothetical protein
LFNGNCLDEARVLKVKEMMTPKMDSQTGRRIINVDGVITWHGAPRSDNETEQHRP